MWTWQECHFPRGAELVLFLAPPLTYNLGRRLAPHLGVLLCKTAVVTPTTQGRHADSPGGHAPRCGTVALGFACDSTEEPANVTGLNRQGFDIAPTSSSTKSSPARVTQERTVPGLPSFTGLSCSEETAPLSGGIKMNRCPHLWTCYT